MLETHSHIDQASLYGDKLIVSGWSYSQEGFALETFKVTCQNHDFTQLRLDKHLSSSDVATDSGIDHAINCRFKMEIPLTLIEQDLLSYSRIELTPIFNGQTGNTVSVWPLPVPCSQHLSIVGDRLDNFENICQEWFRYFLELGGLRPNHNVLDIGSGCARMAYSLAYYLSPTAVYEGFDIVDDMIQWCKETISSRFPNFHFSRIDVANLHYDKYNNQPGNCHASGLKFPYENEYFDFIYLTSVFTHMRGPEVRRYMEEIHRVLKPNGKCMASFFLLNEESKKLIQQEKSRYNIIHPVDDAFTMYKEDPELCIGFEEATIEKWLNERYLQIEQKHYGHWCGREKYLSGQDILIFTKKSN